MWLHKSLLALIISITIILALATEGQASVSDDMNNFFSDITGGGVVNTTLPQIVQTQEGGYLTGGSVYSRVPIRNSQLLGLQMPSVKAGCGGIDMFLGSFSFISADGLIKSAKSIMSAAVPYAFKLALQTISPAIANTMEQLQAKLDQINSFNINSCEEAQGLVDFAWAKTGASNKAVCTQLGNASGYFADFAKAREGCGSAAGDPVTANENSAKDNPDAGLTATNITWKAMKKSTFFTSLSEDEQSFWLTAIGTNITAMPPAEANSTPQAPTYFPPALTDQTFMKTLLDGAVGGSATGSTSFLVLRCDETDLCLKPTKNKTIQLDISNTFHHRIKNLLASMVEKVESGEALTTDEIGLLELAQLPLWRMIVVYAVESKTMAMVKSNDWATITAFDILVKWLESGISEARKSQKSIGIKEGTIKEWKEIIDKTIAGLYSTEDRVTKVVGTRDIVIKEAEIMSGRLYDEISTSILELY